MMWGYPDGFGWWIMFGGLWMVVFWGVVIGLIVWGVGRMTSSQRQRDRTDETPLEIAKKRLARGEITMEQFDELRQKLE